MNSTDKQYIEICKSILKNGYYDSNRTSTPTYKLPHQIMQFDLSKEFPILSTKAVAFKTAIKELLWIYRDQSNDVTKLQEQNVHIWDEWVDENNTIGRGYGYQIKKYNQIDKLIETLKTNPQDRRMIMTMWNIEDLPYMTLQPCCFQTLWDVSNGKLNCMLTQRSGDWQLGIPFNVTQYAVLVHLIAQVTNLKPGLFTHVINNAHIYENQIDSAILQIEKYEELTTYNLFKFISRNASKEEYVKNSFFKKINIEKDKDLLDNICKSNPKLLINPHITNFYDFTIDDINLENYHNLGKINYLVSV